MKRGRICDEPENRKKDDESHAESNIVYNPIPIFLQNLDDLVEVLYIVHPTYPPTTTIKSNTTFKKNQLQLPLG